MDTCDTTSIYSPVPTPTRHLDVLKTRLSEQTLDESLECGGRQSLSKQSVKFLFPPLLE